MNDYRKYGYPPFKVALLHGGPGAAGEMAPVAEELKMEQGILKSFSFHLLANCGHRPWIERQARDRFFSLLRDELVQPAGVKNVTGKTGEK